LDQLESMVRARFAAIANNGSTVQPVLQPLLKPQTSTAATLLAVQTKKPLRQLHLSFPLPELKPFEPHKPLSYIGNILGHEGEHSLLSTLKAAGLAESLSAGVSIEYSGGALYQLNLVLTADGIKAIDDVVAMVMHSIAVLRHELQLQPQRARQRFDEQRQLSEMAFRFIEQGTPVHTAIAASANLQRYAPGKVLYGAYEFAAFDATLINRLLASLSPSNMLVTLASNELPAALAPRQRSHWYQVDYTVAPVSADWQQRWQAAYTGQLQPGDAASRTAQLMATEFALPAANPFIASDFTLHAGTGPVDAAPQQAAGVAGLEVWRKIDDEFELPKLDARIAFLSSYQAASPRRQALANLYALVVGEQLKEYIYPAYLAGMQASFYPTLRGFSLRVSGYNDALQPLLQRLLQSLGQLRISEQRFGELSAELERKWLLAMQAAPHNRLGSYLNSELYTNSHDYPALIRALRPLRYSDLRQFVANFWPTSYWQVLLHGNIDVQQTDSITAMLAGAALPRCACSKPPVSVAIRALPPGQQVLALQLAHADRALLWYFQATDDSLRTVAMAMLSADILHPLMFNALRTEQQLGYIVQAAYHALHKWPGLTLSLQSPAYSEAELAAATGGFIQGFIQQPVSAGVFERHRNALLARLQEDDPNLRARTARYWRSLMFDELGFDHRARLAAELAKIDHASWLAQLDSLLGRAARSLQVRTQSN
ncbi:MAG: insulinase family protein, partial [Gammaproteobacteria bacterium]|nr:insulinase family protein [Gammaproteobacteria bacterium]